MPANIFNEGEVVKNLHIPTAILKSGWEKQRWGVKALTAYIQTKHGNEFASMVQESRSHNGSVTGTSATYVVGKKKVTYMLVEVAGGRGEVHISKLEEDAIAGSELDAISYEFSEAGMKNRNGFKNNPFAALKAMKE